MRAVEITVFLVVAIIVGGLIFHFVTSIKYEDVERQVLQKDEPDFRSVDRAELVGELARFWDLCGRGDIDASLVIHINDNGVLDKQSLFSWVKSAHLCETLQSQAEECGHREDTILVTPIQLPAVINASCSVAEQKLIISG